MYIAVNASNRFAVAMMHLKPSDWKSLDILMEEAITKGMLSEGFSIEEIHQYLDMAGEVEITKTHGRKPVSGLNRAVEYLYHYTREEVSDDCYQEGLCAEVNRELCSAAGFKGYGIPYERMWEDMKRVGIVRRE